MFNIKSLVLAAAMSCWAVPAMAQAITVDFSAISESGRSLLGSLFLNPTYITVTNDIGADGTLHQRTTGYNEVGWNQAWSLRELGGESLSAVDAHDHFFQVDAYLHTDGSSELKLTASEYIRFHSAYQDTYLSFTLACDCSSLYASPLSVGTFAHYDEIRDGEASRIDTYFYNWPDGTSTSEVQTKLLKFSAPAVPEPSSVALMLAGGLALLGVRRWRSMPV